MLKTSLYLRTNIYNMNTSAERRRVELLQRVQRAVLTRPDFMYASLVTNLCLLSPDGSGCCCGRDTFVCSTLLLIS